jgi:hypothetical protein
VEEEIVDAPENDGNASMLGQVKRPNAWGKMMIIIIIINIMSFIGKGRGCTTCQRLTKLSWFMKKALGNTDICRTYITLPHKK